MSFLSCISCISGFLTLNGTAKPIDTAFIDFAGKCPIHLMKIPNVSTAKRERLGLRRMEPSAKGLIASLGFIPTIVRFFHKALYKAMIFVACFTES